MTKFSLTCRCVKLRLHVRKVVKFIVLSHYRLNRQKEERLVVTDEEDAKRLPSIAEFVPKWNAVITYRENGERREIDRRSWINKDNQPLRYTLDVLNIPQYVFIYKVY